MVECLRIGTRDTADFRSSQDAMEYEHVYDVSRANTRADPDSLRMNRRAVEHYRSSTITPLIGLLVWSTAS